MKNVIYFIGLVSTLSIVFGGIVNLFGNAMGDYVIVVGAIVTTVCLFVIDRLSHKKA